MESKPLQILLIEDSPGDVELVRHGLRKSKILNTLLVATDGAEAMEMLMGEHESGVECQPDLVLLDINLPKMNGHEVLDAIRSNPKTSSIPVIVLTTSSQEGDVLRAYNQHANAYIQKPLNPTDFIEVVQSIDNFWLKVVRLPG